MHDISEKDIALLLSKVKAINEKNDAILDATGARYNIFGVLGIGSDELIFSRMLCNLLNPMALHCKGAIFLELFIKVISENICINFENFDFEKAKVSREYFLGPIDNKKNTGGRIDILVEIPYKHQSGKFGIIIENKIYAEDQQHQILRYKNFADSAYKKAENYRILYLTLDGKAPSKESIENLSDESYWCISYKEDIHKWIEKCIGIVPNFPYLRETLMMYKNQIEKLTGIGTNMNNELVSLLTEESNYEIAIIVKEKFSQAKKFKADEILESIKLKLKGFEYKEKKPTKKGIAYCFYRNNWKYLELNIYFEDGINKDFRINVGYKDSAKNSIEIKKKIDIFFDENLPCGKLRTDASVYRKIYEGDKWVLKKEEILDYVDEAVKTIDAFESEPQ